MTATASAETPSQYRIRAIQELRLPVLRRLLMATMLAAWAFALILPMPRSRPGLELVVAALGLALACTLVLQYQYGFGAGLFLIGLTALGLYLARSYPELPVAYFLSLLVAGGVFLLGELAGALLALLITAALLLLPGRPVDATGPLVLVWLTLGLVWQGARPMATLVSWSWHSYAEARERAAELQERQGRLNQVLKDLDAAYNELASMNRKLAASKAVAEEARRAKAEFVANVSHELRTPINMIIGFTEVILRNPRTYARGGLPPALLADLEVVLRNAQHLSDLINDILDLSQIEVGRMGLAKEWTSLADTAREAVAAIEPLARMRGLSIGLDMDADLPPVLIDRTRVRQVLLNLLSNAVRFTEKGEIRVSVRRRDGQVAVSVRDTGPGIAREDIPKLFEPFRQLDGSIRRRYGGTGLGLHISRTFVTLHGGEMAVESEPGQGTTFTFTLPVEDTVPFSQLYESAVPGTEALRPRLTFVVAEPQPALEGLLRRYVDDGVVIHASDLQEAARISRSQPASAIVLRAGNAREAFQWLERAGTVNYGAPLIACAMPGALEAYSEELGLAGYLLKPVRQQQLLDALAGVPGAQNVLVVDDDRDFLRLFARMLRSARRHYTVWQAASAEEALALLADRRPDAIFVDVLLPDLDGPQLVGRIRSQGTLWDIPIFFVTAQDAAGKPLVASFLGIAHHGGLSADEMMRCIQAVGRALSGAIPPADRELPGGSPG